MFIKCLLCARWVCLQCWRPGFDPWIRKIPWRRKWQPAPVFLPGESHGWRSLVGYSPRGRKESDMTERLHFHFGFHPWVGKIPWRRERLLTPLFWPGEFHGRYSPWGSQRVQHNWATFAFTMDKNRVGDGNPFQYSCLENSVDRGAWQATGHGVQRVRHDWMTEHTHMDNKTCHWLIISGTSL